VYRREKREEEMEERGSNVSYGYKGGNGEGEVSVPDREVWRLVRKWEEE
jgi:hypothetical protein